MIKLYTNGSLPFKMDISLLNKVKRADLPPSGAGRRAAGGGGAKGQTRPLLKRALNDAAAEVDSCGGLGGRQRARGAITV